MDTSAYKRGALEAQADIGARAARYFAGTRGAWGEFFTQLMQERFGVKVVHIDCFTSEERCSYEAGYNETIVSHLSQLAGMGAFERTWEEVQEFRQQRYHSWLASEESDRGTS